MVQLGYWLSSEEHTPNNLVRNAQKAEQIGFSYAQISDHFHPWIDRQGQAPFVWSVLGGLSQATQKMKFGTAVTCPIIRIHPAIIAQAAATTAAMMPGRFMLGLGTGENLNEHILGDHWPPIDTRQEMLQEAIEVIRLLWQGENQSHYGEYYVVENAQIYTLPDSLPPILIAAGGPESAELAGRLGDGLISTSPKEDIVQAFDEAGGDGKPHYAKLTVCWAPTLEQARRTAYEIWPTSVLSGPVSSELSQPSYFEEAVKIVTEDQVANQLTLGPDPDTHIEAIQKYIDAGFDYICIHQVGPDQDGFFDFYQQNILPEFAVRR